MIYLIVFLILLILEILYFRVADRFDIIDKPNERSSHSYITLRGGGIVIWFAALIYFILNISESYLFFIGITLVCFVSFIDDIITLSNRIRIVAQFVALSLIFYKMDLFYLDIIFIIGTYIMAIGIINAYNFMDGINGITGIYTIVFFVSAWYINENVVKGFITNNEFLIFPIVASVVFLIFNFRRRAKCFAGDVGSITIAFWIIYVIGLLMIKTESVIWILLLAVYGVDTVCTIIHRLYLKQNIFKAHRLHFFQILSNEQGLDHRLVSVIYGFMQLIVSGLIIFTYNTPYEIWTAIIVLIALGLIYMLKFKLMKNETLFN